ncbi:MAG: phosphatidylglycerophosphatase A [Bdellovibrionales bacterium]|nr:phosphatidylglycerophosphatase A [Bdellovibrionales bacterium]
MQTPIETKSSDPVYGIGVQFADFIATGFWSGKAPFMPGTFGTAAAVGVTALLHALFPPSRHLVLEAALPVIAALLGVLSAELVLRAGKYGLGAKDPGAVVMDEFAGYFVGIAGLGAEPLVLGLGFVVFRCFDILKPPPLRLLEALPGGFGIMADDLGAGIYTAATLHILFTFI